MVYLEQPPSEAVGPRDETGPRDWDTAGQIPLSFTDQLRLAPEGP
jgi:hypothetical protein